MERRANAEEHLDVEEPFTSSPILKHNRKNSPSKKPNPATSTMKGVYQIFKWAEYSGYKWLKIAFYVALLAILPRGMINVENALFSSVDKCASVTTSLPSQDVFTINFTESLASGQYFLRPNTLHVCAELDANFTDTQNENRILTCDCQKCPNSSFLPEGKVIISPVTTPPHKQTHVRPTFSPPSRGKKEESEQLDNNL